MGSILANRPNSRIADFIRNGASYINANTSFPSDSFPGTAALLTGASPKTHGFWCEHCSGVLIILMAISVSLEFFSQLMPLN